MKILFIDPPNKTWILGKYMPNGAYLCLSAYLKQNGFNDITVFDSPIKNSSWSEIEKFLKENKPDIVATSSITYDIYKRILLADCTKKILPKSIFIIGGPHVSFLPEEALRASKNVDYVVVGEGEETLMELFTAINRGLDLEKKMSIKGLGFINNDKFVFTGQRPLIADLNSLPIPDYSIIPVEKYKEYDFPGNPHDSIGLTFTRGCAHKCHFCTQGIMWGHKYRNRSAKLVIKEMILLHDKYNKSNFSFGDNDFLFDKKFIQDFIFELKNSQLDIKFSILTRVDSIIKSSNLIPYLADLGLVICKLGVESNSQENLDKWGKNQKVEHIANAFNILKENKIPIISAYVLWGIYNEEKNSIFKTIKFVDKLGANALVHSVLSPMPGTGPFKDFLSNHKDSEFDYRSFNYFTPVTGTKHYTKKQIILIQILIHFMWCYSPIRFFKNLFNKYTRHHQFNFYIGMSKRLILRMLNKDDAAQKTEEEDRIMHKIMEYHKHNNLITSSF